MLLWQSQTHKYQDSRYNIARNSILFVTQYVVHIFHDSSMFSIFESFPGDKNFHILMVFGSRTSKQGELSPDQIFPYFCKAFAANRAGIVTIWNVRLLAICLRSRDADCPPPGLHHADNRGGQDYFGIGKLDISRLSNCKLLKENEILLKALPKRKPVNTKEKLFLSWTGKGQVGFLSNSVAPPGCDDWVTGVTPAPALAPAPASQSQPRLRHLHQWSVPQYLHLFLGCFKSTQNVEYLNVHFLTYRKRFHFWPHKKQKHFKYVFLNSNTNALQSNQYYRSSPKRLLGWFEVSSCALSWKCLLFVVK